MHKNVTYTSKCSATVVLEQHAFMKLKLTFLDCHSNDTVTFLSVPSLKVDLFQGHWSLLQIFKSKKCRKWQDLVLCPICQTIKWLQPLCLDKTLYCENLANLNNFKIDSEPFLLFGLCINRINVTSNFTDMKSIGWFKYLGSGAQYTRF
jgi:hypothetical protein